MKFAGFRVRWIEFIACVLILGALVVILLPALARSRESSRRSSCQNNLKQWGLVLAMFANEHGGECPPLSPIAENWTMDMTLVYPEYLSDPNILLCPTSPFSTPTALRLRNNIEHPGANIGDFHPDCFWSMSYIYTGYLIRNDAEAAAFAEAYYGLAPGSLGGEWPQQAVETPAQDSPAAQAMIEASIPVMWDRIPANIAEFAHVPDGGNILFVDGHVEFRRYSHYNAPEEFPATRVSAEIFSGVPTLSADCYERTL